MRNRVPVWRIGRATSWMRAHIWLAPLSLPLILFHGGFHFGGTLTTILMVLLILVVASGIVGVVLQQYLPRRMMLEVPLETIYEQIDSIRVQMLEEADQIVIAACGTLNIPTDQPSGARGPVLSLRAGGASAKLHPTEEPAKILALTPQDATPLEAFYLRDLRPFLKNPSLRHPTFGDPARAKGTFSSLESLLPRAVRSTLKDLGAICEEERQLLRQMQLHSWLHNWLLVHIPLSFALLLLAAVHVVVALRY